MSTPSISTAARDAVIAAVEAHVAAYEASQTAATVPFTAVHFPDGTVVPLRRGDAQTVESYILSSTGHENASRRTSEDDEAIAPPPLEKYDDKLVAIASHVSHIVENCAMCDRAQTHYMDVHETLQELRGFTLPRARDQEISRAPDRTAVFPTAVWRTVAEFLPPADLLALPAAVRMVYEYRDDMVWGALYERAFGIPAFIGTESWRTRYLASLRYVAAERGVPGLHRFLRDVCPKGSFKFGTETIQIVDYSPALVGIQQRHSMERGFQAIAIPTAAHGTIVVMLWQQKHSAARTVRGAGHVATPVLQARVRAALQPITSRDRRALQGVSAST